MSSDTDAMSDVALRFHRQTEWFIHTTRTDGIHTYRIRANSERIVELLHRLSAHVDSIVDLYVHHVRNGDRWQGMLKFLPEVREAIGRLRWPLAAFGGVELSVVTPDDQLSLLPTLELVVFSRTPNWTERLLAEGVQSCQSFPRAVWTPVVNEGTVAPDLALALSAIAERLGLDRLPAEPRS